MRRIKTFGILLLLTLLLTGCSTETLIDRGVSLLDELFTGDNIRPIPSSTPDPEPTPEPEPAQQPTAPVSEEPDIIEPEQPVVPDAPSQPPAQEPEQPSPEPSQPKPTTQQTTQTTSSEVTPSHTDVTFFSAGESFRYLPKGVSGTYACEYATGDADVATVDSNTGKVTAVGPGMTKVTMHVESNGQYDFSCIVRCNWEKETSKKEDGKKEDQKPPANSPVEDDEPVLPPAASKPSAPAEPSEPVSTGVTASHSDATFFNPKEHFKLSPVGAGDDYTISFSTSDASVATVNEKTGVVTAVGPGTATVTMFVDCGGSEYTFECIVRCKW